MEKKCGSCNNTPDNLKKCSRCKRVYYCSTECQRSHWPKHKEVCVSIESAIKRVQDNIQYRMQITYAAEDIPKSTDPTKEYIVVSEYCISSDPVKDYCLLYYDTETKEWCDGLRQQDVKFATAIPSMLSIVDCNHNLICRTATAIVRKSDTNNSSKRDGSLRLPTYSKYNKDYPLVLRFE